MTASFTEQMLTIYTQLGMLSRGKESPPPCGEGQGWGATFAKTPPCLRSAQTSLPTRGRERDTRASATARHPDESQGPALRGEVGTATSFPFVTLTKVRVQLWAAASWIPAFAGMTM